ncbi:MAG: hypothetical protein IMW98_09840 [Firmicutes bacterium]|nr:hypothetical protein [Bacillota bacterium]
MARRLRREAIRLGAAAATDILALLPPGALLAAAGAAALGPRPQARAWRAAPALCAAALAAGVWLGWPGAGAQALGGALAVDAAAVLAGLLLVTAALAELARRGWPGGASQARVLAAGAASVLAAMAGQAAVLAVAAFGGAFAATARYPAFAAGRRGAQRRPDPWPLPFLAFALAVGAVRARLQSPAAVAAAEATSGVAAGAVMLASLAWSAWRLWRDGARVPARPRVLDEAAAAAGWTAAALAVPAVSLPALAVLAERCATTAVRPWVRRARLRPAARRRLDRACGASMAGCPPLAGGAARLWLAWTLWAHGAPVLAFAAVASSGFAAALFLWHSRQAFPSRCTRDCRHGARNGAGTRPC